MDGGSFTLRWDEDPRVQSGGVVSEEVICGMETVQNQHYTSMDSHSSHLGGDSIIADTDQIAAENLIFLAQDMVGNYGEPMQYRSDSFTVEHVEIDNDEVECQITEEVITDDWVQPCGQERVEVPLDQMTMAVIEQHTEENDIDVPLPTDQDEYTAMRPYPCDFCSRRFRKKANLVNHMVAHQNDRPFGCNLCGARYVRRNDLLNHLKVHAYVPDDGDEDSFLPEVPKRKPGRRRSPQSSENGGSFSYSTENETTQVAARTQLYGGSGSTATGSNSNAHQPTIRVKFESTDPRRPFVCQHCGVGFAREKALASHSRIHGDDSPIECNVCGELCWSREQLAAHCRSKHPHRPPQISSPQLNGNDDTLSDSSVNDNLFDVRGPELTCRDCGAGFQRADLLRRHIRAAHSYKLEPPDMVDKHDNDNMEDHTDMDSDPWGNAEHNCSVCGEGFRDALELLAHAESHARSRNNRCMQCGEQFEDEASVADHVTRVHGPILSHVCALCGRICRDRRALLKHSAAQHDAQSHTLFCSKCGKSFHNKARLKRHMASHRDKAVTCNVCGEQFSDGRSLMNHRHSHSGTPARQFPCRECGKTFGSRSSQQIHIRIHTGERPYACRFCWKAFADGGTLRKHERIHTGEKPYACAVCPRAFNQRVVLREHVRSHHSAPDARRGTGASPFWCAVCSRLLHTSSDLVQHLIQHCDANTAMKRQPQVGPRKYKRRRKLKPHELVDLSNRPDKDDSDRSEPEMEEVVRPPPPVKRRTPQTKKAKRAKGRAPPLEMESLMVVSPPAMSVTFDTTAGGSARTKGKSKGKRGNSDPPARPKMIHTQKIKDVDGPVKRRGRGPAAATLVTPCAATLAPAPQTEDRIRPRTKNVRYHEPGRPPPATFPASVKPEPETDIAADLRAIQRAPQSTPSRREKIKREPHVTSSTARLDDLHDSSLAIKAELDDVIASASIQAAEGGPFRCEMCSQAFPLHEQLLLHVPVHI